MNWARLVPIKDKQYTHTSTELGSNESAAMSASTTRSLFATRSKEYTLNLLFKDPFLEEFHVLKFEKKIFKWQNDHYKKSFYAELLELNLEPVVGGQPLGQLRITTAQIGDHTAGGQSAKVQHQLVQRVHWPFLHLLIKKINKQYNPHQGRSVPRGGD